MHGVSPRLPYAQTAAKHRHAPVNSQLVDLPARRPYRRPPEPAIEVLKEMRTTASTDVTALLRAWSEGDAAAADAVVALVYSQLRRQASRYLARERRDHTLRPTALVNEAYLRLVQQR